MRSLSNQQKQLLLDYCMSLTSQDETANAEALIASNEEASKLYSKIKSVIKPLQNLEFEPCPNALVERTIWRLTNLANSSQHRLRHKASYREHLLTTEQAPQSTIKSWFWGKRIAIAAVFLIIVTISFTSFSGIANYSRQKSWRQRCAIQLQQIFQGLNQYSSDNDGKLPMLAAAAGEPWWKVGYQGQENHSNTRPLWLLVKYDYSKLTNFVCPSSPKIKTLQFSSLQVQNYNDFPGREYMTYSFKISCRGNGSRKLICREVLMADLSPLFEELPSNYSEPFRLHLNKDMLTLNSINHRRRGQNVLCGDGRIEFIRTRHTSLSEDDIYTLRDTDIYQGCELPSSETDFFLAP
jgi:hypothetical protein